MFIYARLLIVLVLLTGLTACQEGTQSIIIETTDGAQIEFDVDVAKTVEQQQKGLMFVENMADDTGMIFTYANPQRLSFWMKNTLIPLDMLFFDNTNTLIHIEHEATPGDLNPRGPDEVGCSVLEINGGLAKKMGIETGSKLITELTQECLQSSDN